MRRVIGQERHQCCEDDDQDKGAGKNLKRRHVRSTPKACVDRALHRSEGLEPISSLVDKCQIVNPIVVFTKSSPKWASLARHPFACCHGNKGGESADRAFQVVESGRKRLYQRNEALRLREVLPFQPSLHVTASA